MTRTCPGSLSDVSIFRAWRFPLCKRKQLIHSLCREISSASSTTQDLCITPFVAEVTNLARGRVGCALRARRTAVGVEDGAGGGAVSFADAPGVQPIAWSEAVRKALIAGRKLLEELTEVTA